MFLFVQLLLGFKQRRVLSDVILSILQAMEFFKITRCDLVVTYLFVTRYDRMKWAHVANIHTFHLKRSVYNAMVSSSPTGSVDTLVTLVSSPSALLTNLRTSFSSNFE